MNPSGHDLIPLLIEVGDNLDQDIDLGALAARHGTSPFHFHRVFSKVVRETPKKHIERLRLERAWYMLAIGDEPIVEIGAAVGYNSHETFARAFKRAFAQTPGQFRADSRRAQAKHVEFKSEFQGEGCRLSDVCFVTLLATPMLAIRHIGDYGALSGDVHTAYWAELRAWAEARGLASGDAGLGFFPDYPGQTPPAQMRADICIPTDKEFVGDDRVRCLDFAGGVFGKVDHLGPYETVAQAYRKAAGVVHASKRFAIGEGAPMQVFRKVAMGGDVNANLSEVYIPARRVA